MDFDFVNTTFVLLVLQVCFLFLWYYFCVVAPLSKIPSFGMNLNMIRLLLIGEKITTYLFEKMTSLGKQCYSEGLFVVWFLKPSVFIFKEEYVKNVINNNLDKAYEYRFFHEAFGDGLFTGDKSIWKVRRKMFNPIFRTGMLKDKINIFNKYSRKLLEDFNQMDFTAAVEISKPLKRFSCSVLFESVFGLNVDDLSHRSKMELIFEAVEIGAEYIIHRSTKPWLYFMRFFSEGRLYLRSMKKMNEVAEKTLLEMKESVSSRSTNETSNEGESEVKSFSKSFAEVLLEHHVRHPDFTVEEMVVEIKTFMAAGYDATSSSILWSLYLLGQHPEEQNRIYEEVKILTGDLIFEDLQHLTFLECVIKESLRLYPPFPLFGRSLENDTQLGKYKIPKGTAVFINAYLYHRNPDIYSNPNKFDPSRFLDVNLDRSQWTHIPFSAGIRNCIANKFAMLEMKVVLVHILRKFKIISNDDYRCIKLSWEVHLKPDKPIHLNLIPRY